MWTFFHDLTGIFECAYNRNWVVFMNIFAFSWNYRYHNTPVSVRCFANMAFVKYQNALFQKKNFFIYNLSGMMQISSLNKIFSLEFQLILVVCVMNHKITNRWLWSCCYKCIHIVQNLWFEENNGEQCSSNCGQYLLNCHKHYRPDDYFGNETNIAHPVLKRNMHDAFVLSCWIN